MNEFYSIDFLNYNLPRNKHRATDFMDYLTR